MTKQSRQAALAEAILKTEAAVSASVNAAERAATEASRAKAAAEYAALLLADLKAMIITSSLRNDCKLCDAPNEAHPGCGHGLTLTTGLETIPHDPAAHLRPVREVFTSPIGSRRKGRS